MRVIEEVENKESDSGAGAGVVAGGCCGLC